MKHYLPLLCTIFVLVGVLPTAAGVGSLTDNVRKQAFAPSAGKVTEGTVDAGKDQVKLRQEADEDSEVLERIPDGSPLRILGEAGDWLEVEVNGRRGFVRRDKVRRQKSSASDPDGKQGKGKTGRVVAGKDQVKLRDRAEKDSPVEAKVADGSSVEILGQDGDWFQVRVDGRQGYIRRDKIRVDGLGSDPTADPGKGKDADTGKTTPPFPAGLKGYAAFRAPALVVTSKGTLLAFCEGRVNGHEDEGDMDIVLRRSRDNGRSWEELQVVEDDGKNPCKVACPVVLPDGRILVIWCWNRFIQKESERTTRRVFVTESADDGRTWSPRREITEQVYGKDWRWYGTGPCHAIVKTRPPAVGRIVVAARHNTETGRMHSHVIYSDDNGQTWKIGGSALEERSSESTVVELSDGQLMLGSRNQSGRSNLRLLSYSRDGGKSFYQTREEPAHPEPRGCQGSLLNYGPNRKTGKDFILFSNPHDAASRTNGTLQLSGDDGRTWTKKRRYSDATPAFSGYSDIARLPDGRIGVLFECGGNPKIKPNGMEKKSERYERIDFRIVRFEDLD